jgi:subtilisin family serine protease
MADEVPPRDLRLIEREQVALILEAFGDRVATHPPNWGGPREERPLDFLYHRDHLLVRDSDVQRVQALERSAEVVREPVLIEGLTLMRVTPGSNPQGGQETVIDILERLDAELGAGVATPDHIISITPGGRCPATEPEPVAATVPPEPPISKLKCDGAGVLVAVVDTGLLTNLPPRQTWLAGVGGEPEPETVGGLIPVYTGHGTFIAGVVRAMAPRAEVWVARTFDQAGALFESEIIRVLDDVLALSPDVISLSAGTRSRNDLELLGFRVFIEQRLQPRKGVVLVAAAGNDGNRGPFYPAAMRGTVSVGALAQGRHTRATFSNFGHWVDVYAPGENLVNAYANGSYSYHETPNLGREEIFTGMARWSGTSFSTPLVAGLIAARMSVTGENGRQAARALLRLARTHSIHGVGPTLVPGQGCPKPDCQ